MEESTNLGMPVRFFRQQGLFLHNLESMWKIMMKHVHLEKSNVVS